MKPIVGIEISGERIRAVVVSRVMGRPLRRFDVPWRDDSIHEAVQLLQANLGGVSAIGIAVAMEFLFPKQIKLPPVSATEKRRMISLEQDRFFPVASPLVVAPVQGEDIVLGADALAIERWIVAFEQWAPVQNVEGSPSAFVRAARSFRLPDGVYEFPSGSNEISYCDVRGGRLFSARRVRAAARDSSAHEVPELQGVPGEFAPAFGAALGTDEGSDEMLLSEARHRRIRANRFQSLALAGALALATLGLASYSASQARARYLDRIDAEIATMRPRAVAAQSLQGRIELMGIASTAARDAQNSVDPLNVISVLSKRLPPDAVVMTVRGTGSDWQITGTAKDAGGIIPALDADPLIENVRFLAGTSRFTEGRRTYETFSIGFRARQNLE